MTAPIEQALADAQPEETVTLEIPRPIFDAAKEFIKSFGQTLDAADSQLKAGQKAVAAQGKMAEQLGTLSGQPTGLEGFGDQLTAASQGGMGLPMQ
ncbi:MAG: hypothetical protein WC069_06435 [Candidatus Shapirobacteria bacterium]|nr:hypothetical protein [Terrimicrobiaceae bacterium]